MVIIGNKSGQLGNRLFVYAHFIANAMEYGYEVANPSFYDYAHYFAQLRGDFFCRFPARTSLLKSRKFLQGVYFKALTASASLNQRLGGRLGVCDVLKVKAMGHDGDNYLLSSPEFIARRKASRCLLVKGWAFRDGPSLVKHADAVRVFFAPAESHIRNISRLIDRAREDCDLLVGVHIRQGDYKKWQKGKYYYNSEDYAKLMRCYASSCGSQRVKFLICSNAPQDESLFAGLNYIFGNNHQFEDMYSFARCDLLMGPPSTYTMWASFYGSVPLYTVESIAAPVATGNFRVHSG